jgi:arginine-tRNA-protein transferase
VGSSALSAIYCYYDTDYLNYSLGKYSIYQGIKLAREMKKSYYYLGYFIKENRHMSYKGMYKPNEILSGNGNWVPGTELEV